MFLDDIENALKTIDENTFFGTAPSLNEWNYIVFKRIDVDYLSNKRARTKHFEVAMVRENFIPEDSEQIIIKKMKEIGLRPTSNAEFDYVRRSSADVTVEVMRIQFRKVADN